jgi:hypothetical protein
MLIHNAQVTGSLILNGIDIGDITGSEVSIGALNSFSASVNIYTGSNNTNINALQTFSSSILTYTASNDTTNNTQNSRLSSLETTSGSLLTASGSFSIRVSNTETTSSNLTTASSSFSTRVANNESTGSSLVAASASFSTRVTNNESNISSLTTASGSFSTRTTNLETASGSFSTRVTNAESSITSLNSNTGSYATTGSNIFVGAQYISNISNAISFTSTGSLYTDGGMRVAKDMYVSGTAYFNNITVFGTQSIAYISSSQLNIGTNIISVNTDTPTIRFGGLAVYDSGSTGLTGSILWDSENNHWVYTNPSGSSYSGGMFISGPRSSALGSEQGTTFNALMKGQGGDHITSSGIFESGSGNVGIGTNSPTQLLHVFNSSADAERGIRIANVNTGTSADASLRLDGYAGSYIDFYRNTGFRWRLQRIAFSDDFKITADTGNSGAGDVMYFKFSDGNVGIGTTSPSYKFVVNESTTNPIAYFGTSPLNASSRNALIILQSGTIPQSGGDTTGEVGFLFKHSYGTGGVNGTANGGYIESIRESVFGVTSQVNTALIFATSAANTDGERVRITSSGSLLIGTTSTISGNGRMQLLVGGNANGSTLALGNSGNPNKFVIESDSGENALINNRANTPIVFYTSGSRRMDITADGNVGIGTTSPGYKLEVAGAATMTRILPYDATYKSTVFLDFYPGNDNVLFFHAGATWGDPLIQVNGTTAGSVLTGALAQQLVIRGDGTGGIGFSNGSSINMVIRGNNVGIGTTSPRTKTEFSSGLPTSIPTHTNTTNGIAVTDGGAIYGRMGVADLSAGSAGYPTYIQGGDWDGASYYNLLLSPLGGNVGIGTTSPQRKLVVKGDTNISGSIVMGGITDSGGLGTGAIYMLEGQGIAWYNSSFSTGRGSIQGTSAGHIILAPTANVGIGTTSPLNKLHVVDTNAMIRVSYDSGGDARYAELGHGALIGYAGATNNWLTIGFSGGGTPSAGLPNGGVQISTNGSARMTVAKGGDVGIGTDVPQAKLDIRSSGLDTDVLSIYGTTGGAKMFDFRDDSVSGTTAAMFRMYNSSGTETVRLFPGTTSAHHSWILPSGNVGINTTSPVGKLDITVNNTAYLTSPHLALNNTNLSGQTHLDFMITGSIFGKIRSDYEGNMVYATNTYGSERAHYFFINGDSSVGTAAMIIKNNGNVGIGTTSPDAIFHVAKASSGGIGGQVVIDNPASSTLGNTAEISFLTDAGASGAGTRNARILAVNENAGNGAARMEFHTWNGGTSDVRMLISNGGNVGIGSTSPGFKLDVNGNIYASSMSLGTTYNGFPLNVNGTTYIIGGQLYLNVGYKVMNTDDTSYIAFDNGVLSTKGSIIPVANGTQNLGSASLRWGTVFTSDLDMSNGIGDYTIVEGEEDLFLYNNKTNKVFKFVIQEVDPSEATPKMKK